MALTATLPDVSDNSRIVDVPSSGGGFISGLAQFGQQAIGSLATGQAYRDKKNLEAAQNDTAQAIQDDFKSAQSQLNPVPQDAIGATQRVVTAQQAANNGSLPQAAVDLHLESTIDDLYAKHPENKAAIATYMQSQGLDHYLFRDVKANIAAADDAVTQKRQAEDIAYNSAVRGGLINPSTATRQEGITLGQQYMALETQQKMATEQLANANVRSEISERDRKASLDAGNKNLVSSIIGDAGLRVGVLTDNLSVLSQEALSDPTGQKHTILKQAIPAIQQGIQTAKAAAIGQVYASGGGKDQADAVGQYYDAQAEGISKVWTGDLSKDSLNHQTVQGMQDQLSISAAQAFPIWSELGKLPGMANALPLMFGGDPAHALPKDVQASLTKELSGYSVGTPDGQFHLARAASILQGQLKLSDLSLPAAQKLIGTVNTAVVGNGKAIQAGDKTLATTQPFLNGLGQITDAAFQLTPGTNQASQLQASNLLSDRDTVNGLVTLARDKDQSATALPVVLSLNATAQKGILVAKTGDWQHNTGSLQTLRWNPTNQTVEQVLNEDAYQQYVRQAQTNAKQQYGSAASSDLNAQIAPVLTRQQVMAHTDDTLATRAKTINNYLDTFTRTYAVNPNNPPGITPKQAREAAFNGVPLDRQDPTTGKPIADFGTRVSALESQAATSTIQTVTNNAADRSKPLNEQNGMKTFTGAGYPANVAAGIVGNLDHESGYNPSNTAGDGGASHGIAQWNGDRLAELHSFAANQGKPWNDIDVQHQFILHELDIHPTWKAAITSTKTPEEAARAFNHYFEQSADEQSGNTAALQSRAANARRVYNTYAQAGQ